VSTAQVTLASPWQCFGAVVVVELVVVLVLVVLGLLVVVVLVVVEVVELVVEEVLVEVTAPHAQSIVQAAPVAHGSRWSHCSPFSTSRKPSPQREREATKSRLK